MTDAPRLDLCTNLIRRVLDPACSPGEAENAAHKFAVVARREGVGFDAFAGHVARLLPGPRPVTPPPRPSPVTEPTPAWAVRMTCGKYAGKRLGDILDVDPGYVAWLARAYSDLRVAKAAAAVLAAADGEGE